MLLEGGALEIIGRNAESTWWQVATANGPRWLSAEVTTVENVTDDVPLADGQAVAAAPTATEVPPTSTTVPPTATPTPEPEVVVAAEVETDETTADSEAEVEADPDDSEVDQEEAATADEAEPENSAEEEVAATDPESESETVETQASQTAAETCRAISLLAPTAGQSTNNPALEVRWQCDGALGENYGFEVRLWRAGGTPVGVHDAVNGQSYINHDGNTYSLTIPIEDLSIFEGKNKTYQVAVAVVQIAPAYQDLGIMSDAVEFLFE
jgi:hypothetical protein